MRMGRQFDVVIERDEEGMYVASVPQLPGCTPMPLPWMD
jgi:predicted RNase H-like HicB family nuclease